MFAGLVEQLRREQHTGEVEVEIQILYKKSFFRVNHVRMATLRNERRVYRIVLERAWKELPKPEAGERRPPLQCSTCEHFYLVGNPSSSSRACAKGLNPDRRAIKPCHEYQEESEE